MTRRRLAESLAVVVLAPLTLWLGWRDAGEVQVPQWGPPTRQSTVPSGGTGTIAHARWRLLALTPGKRQGQGVEMNGELEVTPLDATGVREDLSVLYSFEDAAGHVWYGYWTGRAKAKRPGQAVRMPFTGQVHASAVSSVRLALEWDERDPNWKPLAHHVLRFARRS
jgi:hypothetical protein